MKKFNWFFVAAVISFATFMSSCTSDESTLKTLSSSTRIYCTLADGSSKSACASADGTTYAPKDVTAAQQANIDFVYFNDAGTSYGIYAPSAVPSAIDDLFSTWATKNATKFATTTINYDKATLKEVKEAADLATQSSVTGLKAGTVVVFKTDAGKVGIFKVNSITSGYGVADYVDINIRVEEDVVSQ